MCFGAKAQATTVERVVAVVGERPILLSDLRQRARPYLAQIYATVPNEVARSIQEQKVLTEALQKMIEEKLEQQAADRARIQVTAEEVDRALANVAEQAKMSTRELINDAKRRGFEESEYREEISRQVLQGKLIQLRVRGRVRVEDEDGRAAYRRWVAEIGSENLIDVRILALRILPGSNAAQMSARETLASDIVGRARKGEDFCALVNDYTDDVDSRGRCGSPGPQPLGNLVPQLQDIVKNMSAGQTSDPVRFGNEVILIVQLASRSKLPRYEDVRDVMMQRATAEAIDRQRKAWLQELRRSTFIDVRL